MIKEDTVTDSSSTESFHSPSSSKGNLMASFKDHNELHDSINDLLTGDDFLNDCDNSVTERPTVPNVFLDPNDIEFLVKCTDSKKSVLDFGPRKDSLMVKFDPLYSKRRQTTNFHNNTINIPESDVGYETGSSTSEQNVSTPKRMSSFNMCREKPMQIVPPAINRTIASINPSQQVHSVPALVRSASAIMPPQPVVTDRLIDFAGSTPPLTASLKSIQPDGTDRLYHLRVILQKQEQEIHQLHQENRDLKTKLFHNETTLSQYTDEMVEKVRKLTHDKETLLKKNSSLIEEVNEKIRNNKQMCVVVEEFENTISILIADQQKSMTDYKETKDRLTTERDDALKHLANMESSFNDLLEKYEKCKSIILETKDRETKFREQILEYEDAVKKYEGLYNQLKVASSESLSKANEDLDEIKKTYSAEIRKQEATIKKLEVLIKSLNVSLAQRDRDNENLQAMCDELIKKIR